MAAGGVERWTEPADPDLKEGKDREDVAEVFIHASLGADKHEQRHRKHEECRLVAEPHARRLPGSGRRRQKQEQPRANRQLHRQAEEVVVPPAGLAPHAREEELVAVSLEIAPL